MSDPSESKCLQAHQFLISSCSRTLRMCSWKLGRREKEAVLSVASFTKRDDNSASYHVCRIIIIMAVISLIISFPIPDFNCPEVKVFLEVCHIYSRETNSIMLTFVFLCLSLSSRILSTDTFHL